MGSAAGGPKIRGVGRQVRGQAMIGRRLGPHEIIPAIGTGAMGDVHGA
jgi:hypothetical protein